MFRWAVLLLSFILVSSCSKYCKGEMSDHFDGERFFDPEVYNTNTFFRFFKWQVTKKTPNWPGHVGVKHYDVPPKLVLGDDLRVQM